MSANESAPVSRFPDNDHIAAAIERVRQTMCVEALGSMRDMAPINVAGHPPCGYVAREIGSSPSADEVRQLSDYPDIVSDLAFAAETAHAGGSYDIRGRYAETTMASMGCEGCRIAAGCPVRQHLRTDGKVFGMVREFIRTLVDIERSPEWLVAGRHQRIGSDSRLVDTINNTSTDALIRIDLEEMRASRGGAEANIPAARHTRKTNFPEIQHIGAISEDDILVALPVRAGGRSFTVVDASKAVGFKDNALSDDEFMVLCGKLFGRLIEAGQDGEPQIMKPDNIMQKIIGQVEGGTLHEIRMSGKNRLYITVRPPTDTEPARIIILGAHGGDAATQRKFIDVVLGRNRQ